MSTADRFELVFSQVAWEAALPRLLTDPNLLAFGHVGRNEHPGASELLVSYLDTTAALPHGNHFPPLTDWIVVACPAGTRSDPAAWQRELEPRASQLLAVALLGGGAKRGQWRAEVFQGKSHSPVASVLVTLNSMNCSIAVQLWLDLLADTLRGSFWHRFEWVAGEGMHAHAGAVGAAADCAICHFRAAPMVAT